MSSPDVASIDELGLLHTRILDLAGEYGLDLNCGETFFNLVDQRFDALPAACNSLDIETLSTMLRMYLRLQSSSSESNGPGRLERLWAACRNALSSLQRFQVEDRQAIMLAWKNL